eukprot:scaffold370_cov289-Prasinococcus_capsulatus_cf.AAC.14
MAVTGWWPLSHRPLRPAPVQVRAQLLGLDARPARLQQAQEAAVPDRHVAPPTRATTTPATATTDAAATRLAEALAPGRCSRAGGFGGILQALQLCGEVDIYGFGSGHGSYYERTFESRPSLVHTFEQEHACLEALARADLPRVRVHGIFKNDKGKRVTESKCKPRPYM